MSLDTYKQNLCEFVCFVCISMCKYICFWLHTQLPSFCDMRVVTMLQMYIHLNKTNEQNRYMQYTRHQVLVIFVFNRAQTFTWVMCYCICLWVVWFSTNTENFQCTSSSLAHEFYKQFRNLMTLTTCSLIEPPMIFVVFLLDVDNIKIYVRHWTIVCSGVDFTKFMSNIVS